MSRTTFSDTGYAAVPQSETSITTNLLFEGCECIGHSKSTDGAMMHQASWISCYLNLINTIMGAGMLGLPYAFSKMGWVLGLALLTSSAVLAIISLHLISLACLRTSKPYSFNKLAAISIPKYSGLIDASVAIE